MAHLPVLFGSENPCCCTSLVRLHGEICASYAEAWTDEARMIRADRTIRAQNATEAGFMGITATSDGQPEPRAIQQALQRGAAVIHMQLMPTS